MGGVMTKHIQKLNMKSLVVGLILGGFVVGMFQVLTPTATAQTQICPTIEEIEEVVMKYNMMFSGGGGGSGGDCEGASVYAYNCPSAYSIADAVASAVDGMSVYAWNCD
jgi:hypothetical protein